MRRRTFENYPSPVVREAVHDLRNLFGIVGSAGHLLGRSKTSQRDAQLLGAIEQAAIRGGELTTILLAEGCSPTVALPFDLNIRIRALAPMIEALAGVSVASYFDLHEGRLPARVDPSAFDAVVLELVKNATRALRPGGHLIIRTRRINKRILVSVMDDGIGMDRATVRESLWASRPPADHGTGLHRVRHFVRDAHGSMLIRSIPQRGTVVTLNLPMALTLAFDEPAAPMRRYPPKEMHHEDRQPVAA